MNRIKKLFSQQKANIAYLTAGDGGIEKTLAAALALIAGGVNLLEIGVPFSDPIADGPVIQRAAERAITAGTTLEDIVWLVQAIRAKSDIPMILFSYANPIFVQLPMLERLKAAGIDGVLIVDCPIEETSAIHKACLALQLDPIYVISPTTAAERLIKISKHGRGFLYYACRAGTTGVRQTLPEDFKRRLASIKAVTALPIVVGFGISNRQMAQEVLEYADGVVVGSRFVKALEDGITLPGLTALAQDIYPGIHG